jgi:hypothetical protein
VSPAIDDAPEKVTELKELLANVLAEIDPAGALKPSPNGQPQSATRTADHQN